MSFKDEDLIEWLDNQIYLGKNLKGELLTQEENKKEINLLEEIKKRITRKVSQKEFHQMTRKAVMMEYKSEIVLMVIKELGLDFEEVEK